VNGTASGADSIAIGQTTSDGSSSIGIGKSITMNGKKSIVLAGFNPGTVRDNFQFIVHTGDNAGTIGAGATGGMIAITGNGANLQHANNIVLGIQASTFADNTCMIGAPGTVINTMCIGRGDTHTVAVNVTIRCTNASGNDVAAGTLKVITPLSTGNAESPPLDLQVGIVGASGGALQTARTGVRVQESTTANETYLLVYDFTGGVLARVSRGAADSGGAGFRVLRIPN
jgi:hypothetical protein